MIKADRKKPSETSPLLPALGPKAQAEQHHFSPGLSSFYKTRGGAGVFPPPPSYSMTHCEELIRMLCVAAASSLLP